MSWIQLVLTIDVSECLVIRMQAKGPTLYVMTLMSQSPFDNIEFLIIGVVITSRALRF
mgnify:CR=1 FL=1